jgi:hypothetical protein
LGYNFPVARGVASVDSVRARFREVEVKFDGVNGLVRINENVYAFSVLKGVNRDRSRGDFR